jgi:two-component system, chemotaxis family, protein-glutamate methylesterase/glutaminase
VVLSGGLNDGTAGLMEIRRRGGVAVVQDPMDAFSPEMPRSALANTDVDHVRGSAQVGSRLAELVASKRVPGVLFRSTEQP